ncbi:MAG: fused MFS/spermidine synthase [Elusimicrobiota bacterium]|jgi:predicted membrane-bound spermidine synthase
MDNAPLQRPPISVSRLLTSVFFLSGFTALIYQVVWQRLLTLYYGVGSVSITLIISVFMGGLGLGALIGGRLAEKKRDRMFLYAGIELLIGVFGLASFQILDALGRVSAGCSLPVTFLCVSLFLLIPTTLMGMTLPMLTKIYGSLLPDFGQTISHLYFINTIGAAIGSLTAAYGLITFGGLDTALTVAAAVNGVMAILILVCRWRWSRTDRPPQPVAAESSSFPMRWVRLWVFFTGFAAIGYEIIWYRVLGVIVKESPYAFATVLAVYLVGLAVGSFWMSGMLARHPQAAQRERFFFGIQLAIACYMLVSFAGFFHLSGIRPFKWLHAISFGYMMHPPAHWPHFVSWMQYARDLYLTVDIVTWPFLFIFLPTVLMGASFPLVSALSLRDPNREASTVGGVYAWTILGNVLGGLVTGFYFLPRWGTENTLLLFIAGGLVFIFPFYRRFQIALPYGKAVLTVVMVGLVAAGLFPRRQALYGAIHPNFDYGTCFIEEGREGVVVTYSKGERLINYINGLVHGGRPNYDFMQEAVETLLYTPNPRKILLIGYGTGELCDIILRSREIEELVVVELNHTLMTNLRKIPLIQSSLADHRLRLVMDDGRRFLIRQTEKYDAIQMDPIYHSTVYSNNLYSRQFFELASRRLTPQGVLMVWSSEHRVIPYTLASVFPYMRAYSHFCLASLQPMVKNEAREKAILSSFSREDQKRILAAREYIGDRAVVRSMGAGAPVNEDWKPRCEYYFGQSALRSEWR